MKSKGHIPLSLIGLLLPFLILMAAAGGFVALKRLTGTALRDLNLLESAGLLFICILLAALLLFAVLKLAGGISGSRLTAEEAKALEAMVRSVVPWEVQERMKKAEAEEGGHVFPNLKQMEARFGIRDKWLAKQTVLECENVLRGHCGI